MRDWIRRVVAVLHAGSEQPAGIARCIESVGGTQPVKKCRGADVGDVVTFIVAGAKHFIGIKSPDIGVDSGNGLKRLKRFRDILIRPQIAAQNLSRRPAL